MKYRWFHWARPNEIADWLRLGWLVVPANGVMHHHDYSFMVEWLCDCKMARPAQ